MTGLGTRPHADRLVTVEEDAGRTVVIKRYERADAAAVWADMTSLWSSGFDAMPEPVWQRDNAIAMSLVDGGTLGVRGDPGGTRARLGAVIDLLAQLQSCPAVMARQRPARKLLRSLARKVDHLDGPRRDGYQAALATLAEIAPHDEHLVPTHGDFSPRNILDDGDRLVLIDFDRLQMAGRGRDLAYLGAWMWVTGQIRTGCESWEFADEAATTYEAVTGCSVHNTQAFHRAAALLRIAASWSSLQRRDDIAARIVSEAHAIVKAA